MMSSHPTPLEAARSYVKRGWMPLPVPFRSKNPGFNGWQKFRVTECDLSRYFNERQQNVGVLLGAVSGDLVDVDLDCADAVALAPQFLPTNGAVFGAIHAQDHIGFTLRKSLAKSLSQTR